MSEENDPVGDEFKPITSQDDFDRRIGQRLASERAKFSDYDELKRKAEEFDKLDEQSKTDLQKAQEAIAERDRQLANAPAEARRQALRFASLATQRGFLDAEDALVFMGDVDLADEAAVKTALDSLAERKPHLVTKPATKPPARPKPRVGDEPEGDGGELTGKERAAAALSQLRHTH